MQGPQTVHRSGRGAAQVHTPQGVYGDWPVDVRGAGELGLTAEDLARPVSAEDALLAIADQGLVDAPVVWGGIPNIDGPYDSQADGFDGRALHQPRVAVEPLDRSVA